MQPPYLIEIEKQMQEVFDRLSEKDKRLYAGVEALKFPYGGISYIAQLFSCSRNTIRRGINELKEKATIPKKRWCLRLTYKVELDRKSTRKLTKYVPKDPPPWRASFFSNVQNHPSCATS